MKNIINQNIQKYYVNSYEDGVLQIEIANYETDTGIILVPGNPHYGGNMDNFVIKNLFIFFNSKKISCGRFSFIPNSDEQYLAQLSIAVDTLLNKTNCKKIIIIGYSMGCSYSLNLFLRIKEIETFILISPTLLRDKYTNFLIPYPSQGLMITSKYDENILGNLETYGYLLSHQYQINTDIKYINCTGYTYNEPGAFDELSQVVWDYISKFI